MGVIRLCILLGCAAAAGSLRTQPAVEIPLSALERAAVDSGHQVVREERVQGSAWPRVSVYQFIEARPHEAAAVFADYARHSAYIPGLKRSAISRRISARVVEVDYVLNVPLFPDEDYTVRDSLSRGEERESYRIDWAKVRARSTKAIAGHASFEPYHNARTGVDGTLITYVNLVSPGQFLAGPLKGRALRQVRETVHALVRRIDFQRTADRALLDAQIAMLVAALAA